jgi:HK97 family phage prohead protease
MLDPETVPRDNLTRTLPFVVERADSDDDGLTLTGYAAVFNEPTLIDSWEGFFDEQIAPGAFRKTLSERTPVLQFDHGAHPVVGSIPIGVYETLREDRRGLFVEARLHDNWLVEPVRDAIASGSITGMSFRFTVVKEEWDDSGDIPLRTLREVKLFEAGPVVWPAYETTTVGVRAAETAAALTTDASFRREVAAALLLGTPAQPPPGTGNGAAAHDEPHARTRQHQSQARARMLRARLPLPEEAA